MTPLSSSSSSSSSSFSDHHHILSPPRHHFLSPQISIFSFTKLSLFTIFFSLFILILLLTTSSNLFQTSISSINSDVEIHQMREAQLQASYLLNQQKNGLFQLLNGLNVKKNYVNFSSFDGLGVLNSKLGSLIYDKDLILAQIELNRKIEQLLLSSHHFDSSYGFSNSNSLSDQNMYGLSNNNRLSVENRFDSSNSNSLSDENRFDSSNSNSLSDENRFDLSNSNSNSLSDENRYDLRNSNSLSDWKGKGGGWNRCRKVDERLSERRTIEWRPRGGKYLFGICTSGQMSNHLICLEKNMFFAAVLDRVLVIPSPRVDYEFHRVLDIERINRCLGRKVVVTFEEFVESKKHHLHIDRFICYFSLPKPCYIDGDHVKKLKSLGVSMSKIEAVWIEDVKNPTQRSMKEVKVKFASDDDVIAIGDVFFADVEKEWVMKPGGPIAHKCKTLIEPGNLILVTAQRFIQTFLGKNYIALHFRRHGFLKFCNVKRPSCFFPVPQAAECITRVVGRANAPVIYLSTDAAESETGLLQSLVHFDGKTVPLIKRPAHNSAERWDALLYRHRIERDPQVEAMLDKTICALSSVFIGSSGSTFTEDILRLRKDWGSASLCDEYLCQGELPNFIAEDESN